MDIVIGIEFIKMLAKHSPGSSLEVLLYAIARHLVAVSYTHLDVYKRQRQEYVLGAVAAEMPVSWPDEALKAQAIAAHSYALYCRDHTTLQSGAWLTADPARRCV